MEFLDVAEVRRREAKVREALRRILGTKAIVGRPKARQWRFLAACLERLVKPEGVSDFDDLAAPQAAQLKFEVHDRLRRFYQRQEATGDSLVLVLVHRKEMEEYLVPGAEGYPGVANYCLLVRDPRRDLTLPAERSNDPAYLERVVHEATEAEFRAYSALPAFDSKPLARWLWEDGPAYRDIADRVQQRLRQGWVLSNPLNPSTHRILSLRVNRRESDEALMRATEYWYLRWWSTRTNEYIYVYRETSHHTYVLRRSRDVWRVFESLRPAPRVVAQNRRLG